MKIITGITSQIVILIKLWETALMLKYSRTNKIESLGVLTMTDRLSELALEALALGMDVLASSVFYLQWRKFMTTSVDLSMAKSLSLDKVGDISVASWQSDYVTARGRIIPYGVPLTSMFKNQSQGVIREVSIVEQVRRASSQSERWNEKPDVLSSFVNSIPFGLASADNSSDLDAAAPSVAVTQWQEADRLDLTTVYDDSKTWVALGRTFYDRVAHLYEHRLRTTERMLLSGQTVTVAGKLKIGPDGGLTLMAPGGGKPYFIVNSEHDELIRSIRREAAKSNRLLWVNNFISTVFSK